MPIIQSAKKRVRVTTKKSIQNTKTKRQMRDSIKLFQATVDAGKSAQTELAAAQSAIDTAVKKGVISKNRAARKKSQLHAAAKATTKLTKKTTTKKATSTAKKAPAKKPAAKKAAPAKKATTKNPVANK